MNNNGLRASRKPLMYRAARGHGQQGVPDIRVTVLRKYLDGDDFRVCPHHRRLSAQHGSERLAGGERAYLSRVGFDHLRMMRGELASK